MFLLKNPGFLQFYYIYIITQNNHRCLPAFFNIFIKKAGIFLIFLNIFITTTSSRPPPLTNKGDCPAFAGFFEHFYLVIFSTNSCNCVRVENDNVICPAPPRRSINFTGTPKTARIRDSISRTTDESIVFCV